MTGGDFSSKDGEAHLIAPGESIAVSCVQESINIAPNEGLLSADIRIDVMFEVFPYGYRDEEKTFRFVAVRPTMVIGFGFLSQLANRKNMVLSRYG
jgi:hypothetical protein